MDFDQTKRVLTALEQRGVRHAVIGCVAAGADLVRRRFGLEEE